MALRQSRLGAGVCSGCRQSLMKSMLAIFSESVAPCRRSFSSRAHRVHRVATSGSVINASARYRAAVADSAPLQNVRALSVSRRQAQDLKQDDHETVQQVYNSSTDPVEELEDDLEDAEVEQSTSAYVPWYLQQQNDVQPLTTEHTAGGQDAPEMPEHPPDILQPITDHLLSTLGLTYVKVMDLRKLDDPPPALGANLLMVVATARSERHLHASADKLCRWLRTEYKLSPYADGLLGRNEMKIAVRRRVRRAKMMSAVGGRSDDSEIEKGLRSGWICVNIGRVEGGVLPETELSQSRREIIGFSTVSTTSAIVVQMMTEEKREELKLEGLWTQALQQQENRQARLQEDMLSASEQSTDLDDLIHHETASVGSGTDAVDRRLESSASA